MKIVVAMDSFKGSISSMAAGEAICRGAKKVWPSCEVDLSPMADGGEGTVDALVAAGEATLCEAEVTGPLGQRIKAKYAIRMQNQKKTAIIEMAAAAGLHLVNPKQRNPLYTTTYGVGELILDAINRGCTHFLIGIGGSATNDGGVGMLKALGFAFLDDEGMPIENGCIGLKKLTKIHDGNVSKAIGNCSFEVACDVTNGLCGENGCSAVFAPQKGATPEMIEQMDAWLFKYAMLTKELYEEAECEASGSGAAGGLGFAFRSYLRGDLRPGIEIVMEELDLETRIAKADLVVTGEGRLDCQTAMGKAPIGVARLAKKYGKPVIAFGGCITEDAKELNGQGIDAVFPILKGITTLDMAMDCQVAALNLEDSAEQVFRAINICI